MQLSYLNWVTAFIFLSFNGLLHAQPSKKNNDKVTEQTRQVAPFDAIKAEDGLDVFITQGNTQRVVVEADSSLIGYIKTEVQQNVLRLYIESNTKLVFLKNTTMKVYITTNQLRAITTVGGTDVWSKGALTWDELEIDASGGSDVKLEINVQKLDCTTSGGSDVSLRGKATKATLDCSGGSDFMASELQIDQALVVASGGSDAHIYVTKDLNLQASGASDIYLDGQPEITKIKMSGASDLHRN